MNAFRALLDPRHGTRLAVATIAATALATLAFPAEGLADATPALERVMARSPADRAIPVIVVLRDQVDPGEHAGSAGTMRADLRATAARTQGRVIASTDAPVERFWLVNALALRATGDEIDALAGRADVASVGLDAGIATSPVAAAATSGPSARPWGLDASRAPEAWLMGGLDGAGVRIGSIDTGVDASHPDLAGKVVAWRDFVAGSPAPYDDNGHGTHTIGTMVGGRAGGAPTGVAPGATVLAAKAMDRSGRGSGSDILAAAQWMTDPDGDPATADQPQVINNSWGMAVSDPWFRGMVQHWIALGIVPVFSAGNTGPGPGTIASPADYPETLAVGAVAEDGRIAPFSSRGPVTWVDHDAAGPRPPVLLPKPDLAAAGVDVVSAAPGGGYAGFSGTSMAAPHVAGAVALVRQAAPGLAPGAVMEIMRRSAADRGPAGPDPDYGAGVLDVPAALALAGVAPAPVAPPAARTPSATAPAASAARRTPTLAQMRRARRIALAADRRVRLVEARLTPGRSARRASHATRPVRLRAADMIVTRRIARGAIRRADALRARLAGRPAPRATTRSASHARVRLTPAQMRITTRLAETALARAVHLQAHPRLRA